MGHGTRHASYYHLVTVAEKWTDRSRPEPTGVIGRSYPGPAKISIAERRTRYRIATEQMMVNCRALLAFPESERNAQWQIKRNRLAHITTHGTHHRAQIINMLTQQGIKGLIEGGDFGGWANRPLKSRGKSDNGDITA
jgi:uncharacterized damage-inducible protein DinB